MSSLEKQDNPIAFRPCGPVKTKLDEMRENGFNINHTINQALGRMMDIPEQVIEAYRKDRKS